MLHPYPRRLGGEFSVRRKWKFHVGVLLAAAVCLLLPAAAALALSGTFKGRTSQGLRVRIKIVGNRVIKKSSFINWVIHCGKGPGAGRIDGGTHFGGKLKDDEYRTHAYRHNEILPNGQVERATKETDTTSVQFAVQGGTATGTVTAIDRTYNLLQNPPKQTGSCKSGKITFTAHR